MTERRWGEGRKGAAGTGDTNGGKVIRWSDPGEATGSIKPRYTIYTSKFVAKSFERNAYVRKNEPNIYQIRIKNRLEI